MYAVAGPTSIGTTGQTNTVYGNIYCGGILDVTNSTTSISTTTGALIVAGGVGIGGSVYIGGSINVTGAVTFLDSQFIIENATTPSKELVFNLSGQTSSTTLTLASSNTVPQTITFPDVTDTLVTLAATQTLTNKTMTSTTNNVTATSLFSATTTVNVASATAPSSGQVLTATSSTTATWQASSAFVTSVLDGSFVIENSSDTTKQLKFSLSGAGTNSVLYLNASNAGNCILTLPGATDNLIGQSQATWMTNKELSASWFTDNCYFGNNTDSTKQLIFSLAGQTTSTTLTLATSNTANRTITFPDITDSVLTNNNSCYVTAKALKVIGVGSNYFCDSTDPSKTVGMTISGATTSTSTTLTFAQTANRVITFPDATDTVIVSFLGQTLENKYLVCGLNTCYFGDATDGTKQAFVSLSGATTSTSTTLTFAQTANRTITFPDVTDTVVTLAAAQFLYNKDFVTDVSICRFTCGNDASKQLEISLNGATTSTLTTLSFAQTANRVITFPDITDTLVTLAAVQSLSSKSLISDGSYPCWFVDSTDSSKNLRIGLSGATTSTNTTLTFAQTANRTITFPDVTDTLVTLAATQTLTNKTVTDTGSSVYATGLWYGSYGGTVTFAGSSAPSSGYALVATGSTAATWQPTSSFVTNVLDGSFVVENTADTTKQLNFSLSGQTTGTLCTFATANTAAAIFTLPTATTTLVGTTSTQTLTNKTLTTPTMTIKDGSLTIQNTTTATKHCVFSLANQSASTTLTLASSASQTSSITLTMPPTASNDTLVSIAATQTLSAKTITDSASSLYATGLWYGSYGGTVTFAGSSAPSSGYVLTATSGTAATWQAASSGGVTSIDQNGGTAETGAVTLTNGNLISITNSGANFTVAVTNAYAATSSTANTGLGVNTTNAGTGNTSIGYNAGHAFSGSVTDSVAIGAYALPAAASDGQTTAIGYGALNVQNGAGSGAGNTAVGYSAGSALTTGTSNTVVGTQAGIGQFSAYLTTGSNNTFVGYTANTTGNYSYETAIGSGTSVGANYATAIGYGATAPGANDIAVGAGALWTQGSSNGYNTLICPAQSAATGMIYPLFRASAFNDTSSATSLAVTIPATSASGDVLIVEVSLGASRTLTVPTGWSSIGSTSTTGIFSHYYYIVDSGSLHGTSPSWSWTTATSGTIVEVGYYNVNATTIFDVTSTFNNGLSATPSALSIYTTVYPSTTVYIVSYPNNNSVSPITDSSPYGYKNEVFAAGGTGSTGIYTSVYDTQSAVSSTPSAYSGLSTIASGAWTTALVTLRGSASGNVSNTIAVGSNVNTGTNNAIVIGENASSTASISLGVGSTSTGTNSVVIGPNCTDAGFTGCVVIGNGAAASANYQTAILGVPSINANYCVPLPILPAISTTTVAVNGSNNYNGAVYFLECAVQAVNLYIDVVTLVAGSTLNVGFYQAQNGNGDCRTTSPQWPLIAYCQPSGAATGSVETALTFPTTNPNGLFQAGYLCVLWSGSSGSLAVRGWVAGTFQFFNSLVPANGIVANFTTSISGNNATYLRSAFSPNSTLATASTTAALIFALSS